MAKFHVYCTMIYNGHVEIEANSKDDAIERVENSFPDENLQCDFPMDGKLGTVHFQFGEATVDDAQEV